MNKCTHIYLDELDKPDVGLSTIEAFERIYARNRALNKRDIRQKAKIAELRQELGIERAESLNKLLRNAP